MGLTNFVMSVNSQVVTAVTVPPPVVFAIQTFKTLSNKYVDITFDRGVYADAGRVNPVTTANFTIVNFVAGGVTAIAKAAIRRNSHHASGTALALIGGEYTIRIFLTLTGTPDGTESFQIRCTDIYSASGMVSHPITSAIIKLNITPIRLWDYLETSTVITTGLGISQLSDVMAASNLTQGTDANRPIDGGDFVAFNSTLAKFFTGGDVGALDFQKGNSFTVFIKRLNVQNSGTPAYIIANRADANGVNGWAITVGADGSLFFLMNDGTLQGVCDYDAFSGSGEHDLFFVNDNGTLAIYNDVGTLLASGNATGIGVISYTSVNLLVGRRGNSTTNYLHGYFEKIAIINQALTLAQRNIIIENS